MPSIVALLFVSILARDPSGPLDQAQPAPFDARQARLLLERSSFAPLEADVARAQAAGRPATIDALLTPGEGKPFREPLAAPALHGGLIAPRALAERLERRRAGFLELSTDHIAPLNDFGNQWAERLLAGEDPLRDRMLVFWHGHFTSSFRDVGDASKMIGELEFLRAQAFGRFGTLLRGIARDPAMLQYLNNNKNVQAHPNENWARELLELFTLGDGHYGEGDIRETARAFSGWSDEERRFVLRRADHDYGQKTILGTSGELDGDDVIEIVLAQPACAEFLARKLLAAFEGLEPDASRAERWAARLRETGYDLRAFLRELLADPQFTREELRARRVLAPLEYCVALARRTGIAPPGTLLFAAADLCGQRVFFPPSVKGWEGGLRWISAGSLLARSNAAAMLLGLCDPRTLVQDEGGADAESVRALLEPESGQARCSGLSMLAWAHDCGWQPEPARLTALAPAGAAPDDAVLAQRLAELLWPEPAPAPELAALALAIGALRAECSGEHELLLRAAHYVLSLPRAHLD